MIKSSKIMIFMPYLWIFLLFTSLDLWAKNIDLSTVPERETVQLTIYNTEDLTLVRETRQISFKPGINPLQFSWANTLIDPTSIQLKFLSHADKLEVLETRFPHDKPYMLYWLVESQLDDAVTIEISYFTSGISWQADYTAIANTEETELMLESFVKVINNSGENYENAKVRLVVGSIHLVEQIASLASIYALKANQLKAEQERYRLEKKRQETMRGMEEYEGILALAEVGDIENAPEAPKEIAKESLSEYFLYTIEGTETIPQGWSKRLRSFKIENIPFSIQYRYRPQEYGEQLVRLYLMRNDIDSKLGITPLPEGMIRIFKQNAYQGLSYLGQQSLVYIPIGDKIELNLGVDPNVSFELVKTKVFRDNILMKQGNKNIYRPLVNSSNAKIDYNHQIVGWNDNIIYQQRIRNYTDKPIKIEIRRSFDGDIIWVSDFITKLHDYRTVEYLTQVKAKQKQQLQYTLITRQGKNAKRDNVTLRNITY